MDSAAREWLDSYTAALLPGLLRARAKDIARRPRPGPTGRAAPTLHAQVPTPEKKSSTPATAAPSPPEEEERPLRPTERAAAARAERERKDAAKKHRW